MRLDIIREVFRKELRETMRDRRSLAVTFGIPLLLYPMLMLTVAGLASSTQRRMEQQTVRVAVANPEAAPHLITLLRQPDRGIQLLTPATPRAALAANQVDAVLMLPADAEARALAAQELQIKLLLDRSRSTSETAQRKLDRLLDDYEQWVIQARLEARGVPATMLRPLRTVTEDVAPPDRRLGRVLSMMLPMMLLFAGMMGAFFPAVNATTAERELGTLETLLVTPATKMELLVAKSGLVLLSGLMTAALNMVSMTLVLWRTFSMAGPTTEALSLDPMALGLAYLAAVPAVIFCASASLVVGLFARNYREANAYGTPIFFLPMAPMLLSLTEPKTTPGLLITPIINTSIVIRDVLTGHATAGAFALAFGSSCLYAGLLLSVAARLFKTEDLVNPAWEPLSMKGLRGAARTRKPRLPAVDEALTLFAVSMLLLFYVSPSWQKHGFLAMLAGNELLLIAAPALLFAWLGRYRWVETFAWRKPTAAQLVAAVLIGVGVLPWIWALMNLPWFKSAADSEMSKAMMKLVLPALRDQPILTVLAVGLLAGICEELLYRGPLQTALLRRLPVGFALALGALLFALAHMDVSGMLFRTILGFILGWMVWRGGSLFPAMLMHMTVDSTQMALLAWRLPHGDLAAQEIWLQKTLAGPPALAIAAVMLGVGWWLYGWGSRGKVRTEMAGRPS
jgi:sodium transport system permease protein